MKKIKETKEEAELALKIGNLIIDSWWGLKENESKVLAAARHLVKNGIRI